MPTQTSAVPPNLAGFRLSLSGSPHVTLPDGRVTALAEVDAALMVWLALEGPTSRSRLATLLWPDSAPEAARTTLRQRLFQLKKVLQCELVCGQGTLAFDRCERRLKDDVGTRPSPETLALLATIEQALGTPITTSTPVPTSLQRPPRLIGRGAELAALAQAWQAGQVAAVSGEAGMGKSRLLQTFAELHSGLVHVAACPGDAAGPFATLVRLLRAVMAQAQSSEALIAPRNAPRGGAGAARVAAGLAACLMALGLPAPAQQLAQDVAATRWPAGALAAPVPDDSPNAREAAKARLRAAFRAPVCVDALRGSRRFGTTCASREFNAPPRLEAPHQQWSLEPGWRGLWSPFLIDGLLLTGSCFNETHQGLSAIDQRTGRVLWRNAKPCREGARNGSVGITSLYDWKPGQVLWVFNREDGKPADHMIVDLRNGNILGTVTPARRGPLRQRDGVFITVSYSKQEQATYLNGMGPGVDQPLWRLEGFHFACDAFNRFCDGAFSPSAGADGVEYISLMAKDQPDPPAKQLHAVDARTGRLLWRHLAQPVMLLGPGPIQRRSDDGTPMVADGRVIIRVDGTLGAVPVTSSPGSFAYRALHPKTGEILWTTEGLPRHFKEPWAGTTSQQRGTHIAAGGMLVTEVLSGDGNTKELWTYRSADGRLAWRRPVPRDLRLMASAGGVIHVSILGNGRPNHTLQGLDSATGTLLWSTEVVAHNNPITGGWAIEGDETNVFLGPFFRIAPDGAIYGTTVTTAYKLD